QEECEALSEGKEVPRRSPLADFGPFLDESGVLRMGGRLHKTNQGPQEAVHPAILSRVNTLDPQGQTLLHRAAKEGKVVVASEAVQKKVLMGKDSDRVAPPTLATPSVPPALMPRALRSLRMLQARRSDFGSKDRRSLSSAGELQGYGGKTLDPSPFRHRLQPRVRGGVPAATRRRCGFQGRSRLILKQRVGDVLAPHLIGRRGKTPLVLCRPLHSSLHNACSNGHYEVCEVLLRHGAANEADRNRKNRDGKTPLDLVKKGDEEVADLMRGEAALLEASKKGSVSRVKNLVTLSPAMINCR
ncbi:unnamed protein product, partial [Cyprideis torosa]